MGQKVSPVGFRTGITKSWKSRWFAHKKDFSKCLVEDHTIRTYLKKNYQFAGIPLIEVERAGDVLKIYLHTARPGIIIGRKGAEVDKLKTELEKKLGKTVEIKIVEVDKPALSAQLVGESIAEQLLKRTSFRRAMKRAVDTAIQAGAKGVKVQVSGRLGGAEMARTEQYIEGSIPLHTLNADVDYALAEAFTTYGAIGIKVWIYKGMIAKESNDGVDA